MKNPDLKARILAAAQQEPAPERSAWQRRRVLILVGAVAVSLLVFALIGGIRVGGVTQGRPLFRSAQLIFATAGGGLLIAVAAASVLLSRGRSMVGRTRLALIAVVVLTPIVLFIWKLLVSSSVPDMTVQWPERLGLKCLTWSFVFAVAPMTALFWIRRGSVPLHPTLTGAAIGVAVGAVDWVLVDLWCPVAYVPHLMLGHVAPLVSLGLLGAALGTLILGPRWRE